MGKYIVNGGTRLEGETVIQGSKNASLPIMAASVLSDKPIILHNVPRISDVDTMKRILSTVGCKITEEENTLLINPAVINENRVSDSLVNQMRSSVILIGALCSRRTKTVFSYPGGCDIGLRPIDLHLSGLRDLGAKITDEGGYIHIDSSEMHSANVVLNYPSVGATENIMLASVFLNGVTTISNAAREPEIIDLQNFLNAMGARVYGAGGSSIYVEGVSKLNGCEYSVMTDRIAAGTFLVIGHLCGKKIFLKNLSLETVKAPYYKLIESGINLKSFSDGVCVYGVPRVNPIDSIVTLPYPAFPTDLQPIFVAMLATSQGTSLIKETVFENRYNYTSQLARMGANIRIEGQLAIVNGVEKLSGANVYAQDLRGGAALAVAALKAKGRSIIHSNEYIKRGYEAFDDKLRQLGADIKDY